MYRVTFKSWAGETVVKVCDLTADELADETILAQNHAPSDYGWYVLSDPELVAEEAA